VEVDLSGDNSVVDVVVVVGTVGAPLAMVVDVITVSAMATVTEQTQD